MANPIWQPRFIQNNPIYLKIVTLGFLGSLVIDLPTVLKNTKWLIFEKLFHVNLIYSQKSAERKSPKNYFFLYFVLMPDLRYESGLYV